MSEDQNKNIKEMNEVIGRFYDAEVRAKKNSRIKFLLHLTPSMSEVSREALELSVRGYNCLKRARINTIGELAKAIELGAELNKIRGCGKSTIQEIMMRLFLFQYNKYGDKKRESYLLETLALNKYVS